MQFLKATAVSLLALSRQKLGSQRLWAENKQPMQNQTEAVPTLRDPLGPERGTQPPKCCLFSTIRCGFISLPLPVPWDAGSRFLAQTGRLLFADEWIIFPECRITLSAMQGKQEAWLIDVLYSPSPSGFHAAALQEGVLNQQRSGPLKFSDTLGRPSCKSEIGRGGRRCTVEPLD